MNRHLPEHAFLIAAVELGEQLPERYAEQIVACSQVAVTALRPPFPNTDTALRVLAELLDEITDALTVQARLSPGAGG